MAALPNHILFRVTLALIALAVVWAWINISPWGMASATVHTFGGIAGGFALWGLAALWPRFRSLTSFLLAGFMGAAIMAILDNAAWAEYAGQFVYGGRGFIIAGLVGGGAVCLFACALTGNPSFWGGDGSP